MINETYKDWNRYLFRSDRNPRNNLHPAIDIGGVVWADSSGYLGNLFVLWLALVLADGTWNLVFRDVPEVDA